MASDWINLFLRHLTSIFLDWTQMNTTTNTYKATQEMMDSFDDNYVAYLGQNPFSMLVLISDGEHRDTYRRNKVCSSWCSSEKSIFRIVSLS